MRYSDDKKQIARFLLAGLINTAFGYSIYIIFIALNVYYPVALILANILGILFNFLTTGRYVFNKLESQRFPTFFGVYVVVYLINLVLLTSLIYFGIGKVTGQAVCMLITVPITFILLKRFVYQGGNLA